MIKLARHITILLVLLFSSSMLAQEVNNEAVKEIFVVRGSVLEKSTYKPIPKVNILVNGGAYTTTNSLGEFKINASKGDELIIKHNDFETIYYIIQDNERIRVEVEHNDSKNFISKISKRDAGAFKSLIDSADTYLKKDAEKSIQFITDALTVSSTVKENAEVYETLGDVYFEWKQYDLAISNYRISLQNIDENGVRLKLAKSFQFNENYQESIDEYLSINKDDLSNWQLTSLYEGLGDVYVVTQDFVAAINAYKEGLQVAQKHLITPKITDLNSKIAEAYNASGAIKKAEGYFQNSLELASKENKKRAVEEKVKVADFESKNKEYGKEIELRKQALVEINDIERDSIFNNESAITPQKQNYKIGSAYAIQKDFPNAIQYLEKSIEEANNKEDLVVQKDATRKLAEVFRDDGDIDKAISTTRIYERLVDELYIKKEQEISQAARLAKDLAIKQNRITSLESDRALSESKYQLTIERNKRQKLIIYSLIGGLLLLLIAVYSMLKNMKQQKLNNNLLALKSLRSQMNPHFIFNALNSVNSFIANNDERTANKYLSDFSLLMRAVLENSEEDFIPLEKEIELLKLYTKLEHFRFKDKFDYDIIIDENVKVNEFQIPPMLLQPYIENAVWHGLRYKTEKGQLNINISQVDKDELKISITDDGIGRDKSKAMKTENQKKHRSKGLGNIKKRVAILNEMYKDKVDVFIDDYLDTEDSGTKVVVTLKKIK
ncbi:histidine kinase [Pontimicrobium sp. SW4]|uniref:Histidine kinase n=1 Tax=Pontimicrobium sp. SW4 TaxID=3153519 RepID=A0AAU7BRL7_9FLAO